MATLREIRRRISSVKNIQKITKAMKMVSAAKLKKAQVAVLNARPYANRMNSLLHHLVGKIDRSINPLLQERTVNNVLIVVVSADRGMCGSFNSNLIKASLDVINNQNKEFLEKNALKLITVGKKATDFYTRRNYPILEKYAGIFNKLEYHYAKSLFELIKNGFLNSDFDKVLVVYSEFKSVGRSNIKIEQLLPIPAEDVKSKGTSKGFKNLMDYIYEPDSPLILNKLLPKHLSTQVWRILLESNASEHGARMVAMDKATDNAGELIRSLNLSFNKARQSSITKELLEIVSGAEALKES